MDQQFDVIVVGAGNGGLAAAANTARAGCKTLLLEKHNLPGGCAASFVRGRFEFEASLHNLPYVGPGAENGDIGMLDEAEKRQIEQPHPGRAGFPHRSRTWHSRAMWSSHLTTVVPTTVASLLRAAHTVIWAKSKWPTRWRVSSSCSRCPMSTRSVWASKGGVLVAS